MLMGVLTPSVTVQRQTADVSLFFDIVFDHDLEAPDVPPFIAMPESPDTNAQLYA